MTCWLRNAQGRECGNSTGSQPATALKQWGERFFAGESAVVAVDVLGLAVNDPQRIVKNRERPCNRGTMSERRLIDNSTPQSMSVPMPHAQNEIAYKCTNTAFSWHPSTRVYRKPVWISGSNILILIDAADDFCELDLGDVG